MWRTAGLIGLIATVLFAAGFGYAVRDILHPQPSDFGTGAQTAQPSNAPAAGDKIQIVALGDSLTKGFGDTSGEGYVGKVKKKLEQSQDKPVYVQNYAENGLRAYELEPKLDAQGALAELIRQANVILLTIGGNDLNELLIGSANTGSEAAGGGQAGKPEAQNGAGRQEGATADSSAAKPSDAASSLTMAADFNFSAVAGKLPDIEKRLESIIAKLVAINPQARIVYVGLYHPYMEMDPERQGSLLVQQWNDAAFRIANRYANVVVVPTYDLFVYDGARYLYDDHFHPNREGYDRIAERVAQVLKQ